MASTYLTLSTSTPTDAQKFTWSSWFKVAGLGTTRDIYRNFVDNNNRGYVELETGDTLFFFIKGGGTDQLQWRSSRKFRDTNAWYHLVIEADSTQATQSDRFKVYLNGDDISSDFTQTTNPSQNIEWGFAKGSGTAYLGSSNTPDQYYNGVLAHTHFIDGIAYDASAFGETDSTTGIWKPKTAPSVSYGSNGFFLKYENSSSMGTDSSGNGNNFTVNGTLTQTLDTPSNVFATLNPITEKSKPTLSNGNLKCGSSSDGQAVYSTLPMTNGYYEMKLGTAPVGGDGTGIHFGVHNGGYGFNGWNFNHSRFFRTNIGYNTNYSTADWGQGNSWENVDTGVSSAINDIIMVAWKDGYLYAGKNGTWFLGADPSAGTATTLVPLPTPTNPEWFSIVKSDLAGMSNLTFNFGGGYFGTTAVTSNSGAGYQDANGEGIFEYQVPTGCYAINTKNINAEEYS